MKKILLFFFIYLLSSHKSGAQSNSSIPPAEDSTTDKMIILKLKIKKETNALNVTLSDKKIVNGTYKRQGFANKTTFQEGDLLCFITGDKKNTNTDTIIIDQPLNRRYEYPGDNGVIGSATVPLDETEIMVRSAYNPAMKYVWIEAVMTSKKTKHIVTLPLN